MYQIVSLFNSSVPELFLPFSKYKSRKALIVYKLSHAVLVARKFYSKILLILWSNFDHTGNLKVQVGCWRLRGFDQLCQKLSRINWIPFNFLTFRNEGLNTEFKFLFFPLQKLLYLVFPSSITTVATLFFPSWISWQNACYQVSMLNTKYRVTKCFTFFTYKIVPLKTVM